MNLANGSQLQTTKEKIVDFLLVMLGSFLIAVGSSYFIIPFDILTGGVAGVSIVISKITSIPSTILINVLTYSMFIIGALVLGKDFAYKTITSSIVYPLFVTILSEVPIVMDIDPLLASVYAGAFVGAGVGIVFRTGASTGGMDIPPLILHKYTGIALPSLVMLVDALTVIAGCLVFGIEKALVGMISVYVSSILIDKMLLLGGQQSKAIYIISEYYQEIEKEIHTKIGRGTTLVSGMGGYTKKERPIIFVVISQKEYPELNRLILHIDPHAFVVVSDATEVQGEGFSYQDRGGL
ncbi:MAG: YitT family protein [Erysipelotrichaceae bacterium]|nr:YitT family protein [Erysipelotrichaceae bacterium]